MSMFAYLEQHTEPYFMLYSDWYAEWLMYYANNGTGD